MNIRLVKKEGFNLNYEQTVCRIVEEDLRFSESSMKGLYTFYSLNKKQKLTLMRSIFRSILPSFSPVPEKKRIINNMKIKPVILFISLVAMTTALSACSGKAENPEEPTPAAVTETQAPSIEEATQPSGPAIYSDKTGEISVSDDAKNLTITLEGNATTGYEWSFSLYGDKVLKEMSTEYIVNDHADGMVGVGGKWVSKYNVAGDGKATILADYQRSWEDAPIESKQITVTISEGKIISVENMQLEIDPIEETFIEETTASERVEETQEAETKAPEKAPETQPQSENEPVIVAPVFDNKYEMISQQVNQME